MSTVSAEQNDVNIPEDDNTESHIFKDIPKCYYLMVFVTGTQCVSFELEKFLEYHLS